MVEIELCDRIGDKLVVESHPEFIDFLERDSHERTYDARLGIATDNLVAGVVRAFDRQTALDIFPTITSLIAEIFEQHPHRDDGARPLALLLEWVQRWPQARITVTGADPATPIALIPIATTKRYSSRGWTVDPLRSQPISDLDRMDSVTKTDIGATSYVLDDSIQDISWEMALQREVRVPRLGSSKKGGSKKDAGPPTAKELNAAHDREMQDDGMERASEVVAIRIAPETKQTLERQGRQTKRRILEAAAAAFDAGRSEEDVLASLQRIA